MKRCRILDGSPAEMVDAEAKDLATKQMAQLEARKAAKKAAETAKAPVVKPGCRQYDWRAMDEHKSIRHDDEAASRLAPKRGYDGFDFGVTMNGRCDRLHFEQSTGFLKRW